VRCGARSGLCRRTLSEELGWEGIDGPEPVNLIFMLAIPTDQAGSTHMQLLTTLTTALVDDDTREAVLAAQSAEQLMALLDGEGDSGKQPAKEDNLDTNQPTVVCVTACPAGIAHTYMAAEYLEKAGRKLGIRVLVEKQGANGIEDRLPQEALDAAVACIFAAEVAIKEQERLPVSPGSRRRWPSPSAMPSGSSMRRWRRPRPVAQPRPQTPARAMPQPAKRWPQDRAQAGAAERYLLCRTADRGGRHRARRLCAAGPDLRPAHLFDTENSWLWMYRKLGGGMLGTLMVPVLAAYTAYSLATNRRWARALRRDWPPT